MRTAAIDLTRDALVHNTASDAHDLTRRPPGFSVALEAAERALLGIRSQMGWFAYEAPAAILAGQPLPDRPNR